MFDSKPPLGSKKLWEDGVYAKVRLNGTFGSVQCLVYDNYGNAVAQYYNLQRGKDVTLHKQTDYVLCHDYIGAYNVFSFETLGFVMDDGFPIRANLRMPDKPFERRQGEVAGNTFMPPEPTSYYREHVNDEYTIIEKKELGFTEYSITDRHGETLWQGGSQPNLVLNGRGDIQAEINDGILMIVSNGEKYELDVREYGSAKDVSVHSINDSIVLINCPFNKNSEYHSFYRLFRYKTGEDISTLLKNCFSPIIYDDYFIIHYYNSNKGLCDYSIMDDDANLISKGNGNVRYEGYDLFSIERGNYFGLIDPDGQWLLRLLRMEED